MESTFITLLLITGLAAVVPPLANRLRRLAIPIVVGEIIAGIVIGRSGFDLVQMSPVLHFLSEFGFGFLMFLAGLEVDFNLLSSPRRPGRGSRLIGPLPMAIGMLFLTIAIASLGAFALERAGMIRNTSLFGLILSTTSMGVVLPVLKERHLLATNYGQYLLIAASIADLVTLVLLTVVIAVVSQGLTLDLLLILVLLLVFALVARVGKRFAGIRTLAKVVEDLSHATAQFRVRGAFALMVAMVVLAEALGGELILGAFLAGAVVGLMAGPEDSVLREKLDAIGFGFFIPIFFIMVGVNFNLRGLLDSRATMLSVPVLVALAYAVKILPALLLRLRFTWRETFAGGMLLSSRLSLIIAVSAIALDIGAINEAVNAAVILVAVITCTVSPMAFNAIHREQPGARRHGVLIAGVDQLAQMLARRLRTSGREVTFVYDEPEVRETLERDGFEVVIGDSEDPETWRKAGAERAEALIILRRDAVLCLSIAATAREFEIPMPIARAHARNPELIAELRQLNVRVAQPSIAMVVALEAALRFPTAFDVLVDQDDNVEVGEAVLDNAEETLRGEALLEAISLRDGLRIGTWSAEIELTPGQRRVAVEAELGQLTPAETVLRASFRERTSFKLLSEPKAARLVAPNLVGWWDRDGLMLETDAPVVDLMVWDEADSVCWVDNFVTLPRAGRVLLRSSGRAARLLARSLQGRHSIELGSSR